MKKSLVVVASIITVQSVLAADVDNNVYINANTGIATMSGLPAGSWTGSVNAGYQVVPKYLGL